MTVASGHFNNDEEKERRKITLYILWIVILTMALICLIGCRTVYVDRPVTHTEYVYRDRVDSVNIHDSVYIKETVKGDTVKVVEYRWRDRFRYIEKTDTVSVRDTVQVVRTEVVEKTVAKMNGLQKVFFWIGIILSVFAVGWIAGKIMRFL